MVTIKEHSTVELSDGPFNIKVHETDGQLLGFTLTFTTGNGKEVWFEMNRADAAGLQELLGAALKEANEIVEEAADAEAAD